MKKIFVFISLLIIMLQGCIGCKETGSSVNLTPVAKGNYDTVYTLTGAQIAALSADPHNVLVEEFTGQDCSNCPAARAIIDSNSKKYPGRINGIELFPYGPPQAIPPTGHIYDFEDSVCTEMGDKIYKGIPGLPCAGIDRSPVDGTIALFSANWSALITSQLSLADSVNLALKSSFDTTTRTATIIATITYLQTVTTKQSLTVVITEDSLVDLQAIPGGIRQKYLFNDVFRDMVSSHPSGSPIMDTITTKTKGMTLQRTFSYKLRTKTPVIVPANCHVIAFVHSGSGTDQMVWQSTKTSLK